MNMVQGLLGSSAQPVDGRTGLGARLARNSASGRGIISRLSTDIEVFCVLKCEGQERRTLKIPVCDKYVLSELPPEESAELIAPTRKPMLHPEEDWLHFNLPLDANVYSLCLGQGGTTRHIFILCL